MSMLSRVSIGADPGGGGGGGRVDASIVDSRGSAVPLVLRPVLTLVTFKNTYKKLKYICVCGIECE
jgi:hypothetical protein